MKLSTIEIATKIPNLIENTIRYLCAHLIAHTIVCYLDVTINKIIKENHNYIHLIINKTAQLCVPDKKTTIKAIFGNHNLLLSIYL